MPKWLFYSILSALLWGLWGLVSKLASGAMSPYVNQILATIGLLPVALLVLGSKQARVAEDRRRGALFGFVTGLIGGTGNIAYYAAMSAGGLASIVTPLTAVYPLVTVAAAYFLLRERLNSVQFAGIGLTIVAVALLSGVVGAVGDVGKGPFFSLWMTYSLIALALWGFTGLTQKLACNYISAELSYLFYVLAFLPIAAFIFLTQPLDWNISPRDWLVAISGGALLGAGTLTSFVAYRCGGSASIVTMLAALYPVVTIVLAVPLLRERIGLWESVGIACALVGGAALAYEKKPETAPEAAPV
jgi:uncharacterized membrane protein